MRSKPSYQLSEVELIRAMLKAGKVVTHRTLSNWRASGLMPPLSSQGLGKGPGRRFYWRESAIFAHASYVYELTRIDRPRHAIILLLWLSGFEVTGSQLRRAWLHQVKHGWVTNYPPVWRSEPKHWPGGSANKAGIFAPGDGNLGVSALMNLVLGVSAHLSPNPVPARTINLGQAFDVVFRKLGPASDMPRSTEALLERIVILFQLLSFAIEKSVLPHLADDCELVRARDHTCTIGRLFKLCTNKNRAQANLQPPFWTPAQAECLAAPLFMYALALIRMGYAEALAATSAEINSICDALNDILAGTREESERIANFRRQFALIWQDFLPTMGTNSNELPKRVVRVR